MCTLNGAIHIFSPDKNFHVYFADEKTHVYEVLRQLKPCVAGDGITELVSQSAFPLIIWKLEKVEACG